MKKVALSLASVLAAATFAQEASAVPAFARQTGMACTACHAQHFPILNGFGRAFKAAGFTMMGAQEKVEGEHLSIPGTLNFGLLIKARYQKSDGAKTAAELDGETTNGGQWQIPDEYSMFWGGRVADTGTIKIGSLTEFDAAGGGTLGLRIPIVVDLDTVKLSVIPFATDALGAFYGYTESSTGVTRGIRWAEHRKEISAHQYTGMGAGAWSGLGFVAKTDMAYVSISRMSPHLFFPADSTGGVQMQTTGVNVGVTPSVAGFDVIAGFQMLTGESYMDDSVLLAWNKAVTKATGVSLQALGEVAGMEAGVYAQYAKVPKTGAGEVSALKLSAAGNASPIANDISATTVGVDVTVIPHALSIGAALRNGKNSAGKSDNAVTLTAVYDLMQNVALHANYSMYSGDAYTPTPANGKTLFTGMLEAAW